MAPKAAFLLLALSVTLVSAKAAGQVENGTLPNGGKVLALLVAGSNGYSNYRHQADICHAYQTLRTNGIPEENIIVMMFDDIATNEKNPTQGIIINRPGGSDVYKGVKIDYKGEDVNPEVFLSVLEGNSSSVQGKGTGRVIKSGPNDHIFVNFADHGAPGLLAFPKKSLFATNLYSSLERMTTNKQFGKMVLYIEACESGSMFDTLLPDDTGILALTAADPRESSYACYYDDERKTYLGDWFSVNWMENSDLADLTEHSIHRQFQIVRNRIDSSHVQEYGELDSGSLALELFLGHRKIDAKTEGYSPKRRDIADLVPSREVPLEILKRELEAARGKSTEKVVESELQQLLESRRIVDSVVDEIVHLVTNGNKELEEEFSALNYHFDKENRLCYEQIVSHFDGKCFNIALNPYVTKHLYKFVNMCSSKLTDRSQIFNAIDRVCKGKMISNVM